MIFISKEQKTQFTADITKSYNLDVIFVEEFYLHGPIRIVIAKTLANIVAFRCSTSAVLTQVQDLSLKHRHLHILDHQ